MDEGSPFMWQNALKDKNVIIPDALNFCITTREDNFLIQKESLINKKELLRKRKAG
jgi:hypothetical protein